MELNGTLPELAVLVRLSAKKHLDFAFDALPHDAGKT
jgi:hypothetical protein